MKREGTLIDTGLPCKLCDSSDAMSIYEKPDGVIDGYCFSCRKYIKNPLKEDDKPMNKNKLSIKEILTYPIEDLNDRGIDKKHAEYYGVRVSHNPSTGEVDTHYYPVHKEGKLTGFKVRRVGSKDFYSVGDVKKCDLFGQHLCGDGGKLLIITEGECDALAARQLLDSVGKNYRVCSLPHGANTKDISRNIEWLEGFEKIILAYDQDEVGNKAAEETCDILPPGRGFIMNMSEKDPNDMLLQGKAKEFFRGINNSKEYRPDGIVTIEDIFEEAIKMPVMGASWPWPSLTKATYGRRRKEMYGFGAGSGSGKTELFKEIQQHIIEVDKLPIGLFSLEEEPQMTAKQIAGKLCNKRFHLPDGSFTQSELIDGIKNLSGKVYMYNHGGQKDWTTIKSKIRYLVQYEGIKDIFLDHLTALVSSEDDKNKSLEIIMSEMAELIHDLDFTLYFVSHLSTPDGKPHEEGGRVTANQFRGSRTIMFWAHYLFGLERDQQEVDEDERNKSTFRVLKDRLSGMATGRTFDLRYNHHTGRMLEEEE